MAARMYPTAYNGFNLFLLEDDSGNNVVPIGKLGVQTDSKTYGVGKPWQQRNFEKYSLIEKSIKLGYTVTAAGEMEALKAFFTTTISGRLTPFWCPSWMNDHKPIGTQSSTTALKVVKGDRTGFLDADDGVKYRHIIVFEDGLSSTPVFAEVTSVTLANAAAGYDVLNLDASVDVNKGSIIMDLIFSRMASDSLKVSFAGAGRYKLGFSCVELQRETPT